MIVSYACAACSWGDWSEKAPEKCPTCGGDLRITDRVQAIELGIPQP